MELWVAFTLLAAAAQTLRFALQKALGAGPLSPGGATFARFLYAAPLAAVSAGLALAWTGTALPPISPRFLGLVMAGGLAQIVATELTVRLFGLRSFASGIAFTKTETIQIALVSTLVLGEAVSSLGFLAIAIGFAGVIGLSRVKPGGQGGALRPIVYGLVAGGLFAIAALAYRGATLALEPAPFLLRALVALAAATAWQTLAMILWLSIREPGEIRRVLRGWRRTAPVGILGLLGSLGWFAAFALQNAAYVRALGQIEVVFTVLASTLYFRERLGPREIVAILLITLSVLLLVLGAG